MLIKLVEVKSEMRGGNVSLSEIYVNTDHIISVSEDPRPAQNLVREVQELGLEEGIRFSRVVLAEGNQTRVLTVVGTAAEVHHKVKKRQVLRG